MSKLKMNNKGFTLVELIIAISIFSIVIFIGYNLLNNTNESVNKQHIVTKGQMNVNLVNKYLTKDLEQCVGLVGPSDMSESFYQYEIKINENDTDNIIYKVSKSENNNKKYYSVERKSSNYIEGTIEIIANQVRSNEEPFTINVNSLSDSLYEVILDYDENNKLKTYEFDVASRILLSSENVDDGKNPDETDIGDIRFGYEENDDENDKIWTSIDPKKNGGQNNTVPPKVVNKQDKYNVNVYIDRQSGKSYSQIMSGKQATSNANFFKDTEINSIKLQVEEGIAMELNISIKYKNNTEPLEINISKDTNGYFEEIKDPVTSKITDTLMVYNIPPEYNGKKQESITITGSISRLYPDSKKGELIIQLGKDL